MSKIHIRSWRVINLILIVSGLLLPWIRFDFDNVNGWKSGSSVQGHVFANEAFDAVTVPPESIVLRPEGTVVYLVKDGKAVEVSVEIGYQTSDYVAISGDVNPGDLVVKQGSDYLNDGTPVEIKEDTK